MSDPMADAPQAPITAAALEAAMTAAPDRHLGYPGGWEPALTRDEMRKVLEAAAPHIHAQANIRITELHKLAAAMLASFHRTSDGYRARVGQVQLGRWRIALDWENTGV